MSKLFDNIKPVYALDAEAYSTDTTGTDYVDTKGFSDGMLVVAAGDIGTTAGDQYTLTVLEGDTTSSMSSTGISVTFDHDDDNTIKSARIAGLNLNRKRYLRVDLTCSAGTESWEGAAVILLGEAVSNPVDNS